MAEHAEAATSGTTFEFSRFAVRTRFEDVPHAVTHEGIRAVVNWVGCVLGSSTHEAVLKAQDVLGPYAGPSEATVLGSGRRFNMMHAALFNSMSSSAHVFDDTHLRTVLHPTSPIGAAALAVAEHRRSSGQEFLMAVVLGNEVGCRVANMLMMPPAKAHIGMYMTGVAGSVGATVAAGRLMGLNEQQMAWAIGIGASQASGLRVMHGSHTTSFMPGVAARAGVTSAILAASNFTATERSLEAKRGLADVFANPPNIEAGTDRLGQHYELLSLTYKPYPCGIVAHPVIEACLALATKHNIDADQVDRIDAWVNPVALDLTGIRHPRDSLQSHNSLYHWVAAAALFRRAGLREEADECVQNPAVKAFREKIYATAERTMQPDACRLSITLRNGQKIEHAIYHCAGSEQRPMTESELDDKFIGQAETVLSPIAARAALQLCRSIKTVRDMGEFVKGVKNSNAAFSDTSRS